jgi:hypothetical protein
MPRHRQNGSDARGRQPYTDQDLELLLHRAPRWRAVTIRSDNVGRYGECSWVNGLTCRSTRRASSLASGSVGCPRVNAGVSLYPTIICLWPRLRGRPTARNSADFAALLPRVFGHELQRRAASACWRRDLLSGRMPTHLKQALVTWDYPASGRCPQERGHRPVPLCEWRPLWLLSLSAICASKPSRRSIPGSPSTTVGDILGFARRQHNEPARCSASRSCGKW